MDFIALTNMGHIKVGDPKNTWQKKFNRPVGSGMQDEPIGTVDDFGISSINMKMQTGESLSADKKSIVFSDLVRAAYARKINSNF